MGILLSINDPVQQFGSEKWGGLTFEGGVLCGWLVFFSRPCLVYFDLTKSKHEVKIQSSIVSK